MDPLSTFLATLGLLDPIRAALARVAPNPYAPKLPAQSAIASVQSVTGLRGGLAGGSGSEYRFDELAVPSIAQDVTNHRILPSWFRPNLPDPKLLGYQGPLVRVIPWGEDQRARAPRLLPYTLLPPRARTPAPKDVAAAYVDLHRGATRLQDSFES